MRLLLCGDFACHTGLARVTEAIADGLASLGWEIAVLAVNYHGDHTPLSHYYRLYPAEGGGDPWGAGRIAGMVKHAHPDAILMVHDPWNAAKLLAQLPPPAPPVVAYVPVDATSLHPAHVQPLNSCAQVVAYTQFGLDQLRVAGLEAEASVIPHGIDLDLFAPIERALARQRTGLRADAYAVLVLDKNQPRKRLDIAFEGFALFAQGKPDNVVLVYHGPLVTRNGWDLDAVAADLGIGDRLVSTARQITPTRGVPNEQLAMLYSMCDVKLSTTSGEGWGLTTMEAMACGLPNIVPNFAALGEWARDAALLIDAPIRLRHCGATDTPAGLAGINTVGCAPLAEDVAAALDDLYWHPQLRDELRGRGFDLVSQERFRWPTIAAQFDAVLRAAVEQAEGVAV